MLFGIVLHYDRTKLFGYLEAENGQDYWFHASRLNMPGPWAARKVKPGEIGTNRNRGNEIAVNVTPIPAALTPEQNGGNGNER
jgi:cold shock CspA family protein